MCTTPPDPDLRKAYRDSIGKILKHLNVSCVIRQNDALALSGLLQGAAIALEHAGDHEAATLCGNASRSLHGDWHTFLDCVPRLYSELESRP